MAISQVQWNTPATRSYPTLIHQSRYFSAGARQWAQEVVDVPRISQLSIKYPTLLLLLPSVASTAIRPGRRQPSYVAALSTTRRPYPLLQRRFYPPRSDRSPLAILHDSAVQLRHGFLVRLSKGGHTQSLERTGVVKRSRSQHKPCLAAVRLARRGPDHNRLLRQSCAYFHTTRCPLTFVATAF